MEFDYTITTQKDFDVAVSDVQAKAAKAGFRVLYVHDVEKTLAEKGFAVEPMKIIEFCNAKAAHTVLCEDKKIGLCLPCKILVYRENGKTVISGMRPVVLSRFFPEARLGTLPDEIDGLIKTIIDNSV